MGEVVKEYDTKASPALRNLGAIYDRQTGRSCGPIGDFNAST